MDYTQPPWVKREEPEVAPPAPGPDSTELEQAYFDKTIRHLVDQGKRAYDEVLGCRYLAPDGTKCAVGCHIPDGDSAQRASGGVPGLKERYPELAGVAWPNTEQGLRLAATLQELHDAPFNWDENGFIGWREARQIARRYRLAGTVVDTLELASRPD